MLDIMHDMNQEAIQQSMLAFDAVEDEMCTAYLAQQSQPQVCCLCGKPISFICSDEAYCDDCLNQQAQEDAFQEYLESPQVIAEGKAFELYHGEVE